MAPGTLLDRLSEVRSRGQVKALGQEIDLDPALREEALRLLRARGLDLEGEPGRDLVRALRQREADARRRKNPIRRDEGFRCQRCGAEVPPGGRIVRDHCPFCLASVHVDRVPGDRAADCGGLLLPVGTDLVGGELVIRYRCERCGHLHNNRAHPEDQVPGAGGGEVAALDLPFDRARTLPQRVIEAIAREELWPPGARVVVAVSGGLDSTVLLAVLVETAAAHGGQLEVASVDHGLRPEAVGEVARVERWARELGLPFHTTALGLQPGPALQERAREARRAWLLSLGAGRVALAHQADDQAETVLLRLLEGAGAHGLAGMAWRSGPLVRPLLDEPRPVLLAWARSRGLSWVEDPSNPGSLRGRVREAWGVLEALRPGCRAGLCRSAELLARDDAFLEAAVEALGEGQTQVDVLRELHPAVALRALRRVLPGQGSAGQWEALWRAVQAGAGEVVVGGTRVVVGGGVVRVGS